MGNRKEQKVVLGSILAYSVTTKTQDLEIYKAHKSTFHNSRGGNTQDGGSQSSLYGESCFLCLRMYLVLVSLYFWKQKSSTVSSQQRKQEREHTSPGSPFLFQFIYIFNHVHVQKRAWTPWSLRYR